MDWSSTLVGPVEGWPQKPKNGSQHPPEFASPDRDLVGWPALHAVLQRRLTSRYWVIPSTHSGSAGRAATAGSEIWPVIGPMLKGVYATGEATSSEDPLLIPCCNLLQEEAYFTFSYGPIRDDNGRVCCLGAPSLPEPRCSMARSSGSTAPCAWRRV